MRLCVSDRVVLAGLGLLALSSLGLKAAAGPPRDGLMDITANQFEHQVAALLRSQQFTIGEQRFSHRSTLIVATRGTCRLAARDARDGAAVATAFSRDAADIGTVRYLYRGRSFDQPPAFAMRLGRIETEVLSRLGMPREAPMPVALAASSGCGEGNFGLADVTI